MSVEDDGKPSTAERVRIFCSSYFTLLVAGCLLLAIGGAVVAADAHTGPDTTNEQQTVGTWTTDSAFDYTAVVRKETGPFDRGELLRSRSTYFSTVTPVLNGTYKYEHEGPATARVSTDLALVVRAVSRDTDGGVLWQERERITSETTESLSEGDEHRVPFAVNVTERIEYGRSVRNELGSVRGRIEVLIVAETEAKATLKGESLTDARAERIEMTPETGTYDVAVNTSGTREQPVSQSVAVPVTTDPLRAYGSLLALLSGVIGATCLVWAKRGGRLEVPEEVRLAIEVNRDRNSFDEWISTGRVPSVSSDRVVTVDSLEGLVDVAIDSNRRVVEDAESGTFVVLDGETRYEFRPESAERLGQSADAGSADVAGQADVASGPDDRSNSPDSPDSRDEA